MSKSLTDRQLMLLCLYQLAIPSLRYCQWQLCNMYFLLVPKRNLKTMLRYPYLFSLPYKLIRDVLKKIQDKGMVSQDLFQGVFRGKGKSPVGSVVQWFFRNALLLCGVCALASQTLWCQNKQEENSTGRREIGQETVGFGDRDKGGKVSRDSLNYFTNQNSRNYKFKILF